MVILMTKGNMTLVLLSVKTMFSLFCLTLTTMVLVGNLFLAVDFCRLILCPCSSSSSVAVVDVEWRVPTAVILANPGLSSEKPGLTTHYLASVSSDCIVYIVPQPWRPHAGRHNH